MCRTSSISSSILSIGNGECEWGGGGVSSNMGEGVLYSAGGGTGSLVLK